MLVIRRPVDLARTALDEATKKLRQALAITTRCVNVVDASSVERLSVAVTAAIYRGEASRGLRLTALLDEAGISAGHVRDRHFTPALSELADLTIRMTAINAGSRAVRCESLYVTWARTGRDRNSLATDHIRNVTPGIRFSGIAISCDDRHLQTAEIPFVTGTRHDHASSRADRRAIGRLTREMGRPPNSSPAEHFAELLELQRCARARLRTARLDGLLAPLENLGFSDLVVAGPMPCGPAPKRSLHGAETYWPGRDQDLIEVLHRAGKRGVAHMGRRLVRARKESSPAELSELGFEPWQATYSLDDRKFANDTEWRVSWHWNKELECLARVHGDGTTVRIDEWRVVALSGEVDVAIALIRRQEQRWMHDFMEQNMRDTAPGLIKASSYRSNAALRDLLRVGFAGLVDAERQARSHELGASSVNC